jgi:AraC-like DNA-binding protein
LLQLLDLLPDVGFFIKDQRGRFQFNNRRACETCGVGSEAETLGRTDHDFWPKARADIYAEGDRAVLAHGTPIINAIEPEPGGVDSGCLIIVSKVALRDRRGRIIGVAGIHRRVDGQHAPPRTYDRLARAMEVLHQRYTEPLDSAGLARLAGLSRSQFDRHFQRLFGTTAHEYLLRLRVEAACRRLETEDTPLTELALTLGFYDHSHFSRTFQRLMGLRPSEYRRRRTGSTRRPEGPGARKPAPVTRARPARRTTVKGRG